ncbi:MAG: ABC transporter ATP-binding protein [Lachnospiraceae bacterium]|nr:ABC transporter ATP-binding protein [Lachnospiraceae bacterium]
MNKKTIFRVINYISKYWYLLLVYVLVAVVSVVLTLHLPKLIGDGLDCIIGVDNVDFAKLKSIIIEMIIVIGITAIAQWIMTLCNNKIAYNIVRDMRKEAFEKLNILPLSYIDRHPHGEVVSKIINDVDQFSEGILMGMSQLFTGVITIVLTVCILFTLDIRITLAVLVITPASLLVANFISKRTFNMFKLQSEIRGEQTSYINEMMTGAKVVQAFGYEERAIDKFEEINERLTDASLRAIFFSSIVNPSTRFINAIVYAATLLIGALIAISGGSITVGQISRALSYANQYTKPFNEITSVIAELQNALACGERIFALIDEQPQSPDNQNAVNISEFDGTVELNNVNFSYVPDKKLIENFNLSVEKGQRIAIVGPTGCGKTTLINLLMRFYDVNSGDIKLNDVSIYDMTRDNLREAYGMVLQETWLKNGTIKENISMGRPDASMDEIIEAAKSARAHGFIKRLPNGYDTVIGEGGGSLSQGQKQLLCIARVMLLSPSMLILDEATSSIDTRTEIKVQEAFLKLMEGRTSFIVAHRLSTIKSADIILVMKNGNVIEQGNHNELMKMGGFYSELYNSQTI